MVVGICKLAIHLHECHSLKEKRGIVRRVKERAFNQFKIPISEVGSLDMWQRAELGFAVVSNDRKIVEGLIQRIADFVEDLGLVEIIDQYQETVNV